MTNIKLVFKIGKIENETMSLKMFANNQLLLDKKFFENDRFDFEFNVDLPAKIKFDVSGKKQFNTRVDENGNVLQDKHILVAGVCVDGVWIKKWFLESKFFCPTGSNYFGQNKIYWFEIPYEDIMDFWLECVAVD